MQNKINFKFIKKFFFVVLFIFLTGIFFSCSETDSTNDSTNDTESTASQNFPSWTKLYGTTESEEVTAGVMDSNSNIYLAGFYDSSSSGDALIILKYSKEGNLLLEKKDTNVTTSPSGIASDLNGNIYISYNNGGTSGRIRKYSSSLTFLWERTLTETVKDIKIMGDYLYATGGSSKIYTGKFLITADAGSWTQWEKTIAGNLFDSAMALCLNSSNIFITGYFTKATLNGKSYDNKDSEFIIKYDLQGNVTWTAYSGLSPKNILPWAITVDSSDNVYIAGSEDEGKDVAVSKFSSTGTRLWTKYKEGDDVANGGSDEAEQIRAILINGSSVIIGGDLGDGNATNMQTLDAYLGYFNSSDGSEISEKLFGDPSLSGGLAARDKIFVMLLDNDGNLYIAGETSSDTLNGETTPGGGGNADIFIMRYK